MSCSGHISPRRAYTSNVCLRHWDVVSSAPRAVGFVPIVAAEEISFHRNRRHFVQTEFWRPFLPPIAGGLLAI